jgi:cell division protein FtsQ
VNAWHNEKLLNGIANGLFTVAGLVAGYFAVVLAATWPGLPLRVVTIEGDVVHVTEDAVSAQLEGRVQGNFLGADLEAVRAALQELPWVRRVEVRRQWPDRIAVRIEEHVALARWPDERLLNTFGELFVGAARPELPLLTGPAGSEREVAERYRRFRELLAPIGGDPTQVLLSPRQAWQVRVALPDRPALTLELGRDQPKQPIDDRLARFIAAYPSTVGRLAASIDYVDLRYPNGFALRVPDLKWDDVPEPKRKRT